MVVRKEVENWWKQAEEDFSSAKFNFDGKKYYLAVFLCQQAVEKGLKAYFLKVKRTSAGLTHSLVYLATEIKMPKKFFSFLRRLTPQFVDTRYPDASYGVPSEFYDDEFALEFIEGTEEVMEWLRLQIKK